MFRLCIWWVRYFSPLRYLPRRWCAQTVNLAVVSIRALFEVSRRGRHEPPSMALACLSAHRVRFPAVHLLPGCLTSARFTKRRTNSGADIRRTLEISARKNANKETSIRIKIPLGAICSLECELWHKSYRDIHGKATWYDSHRITHWCRRIVQNGLSSQLPVNGCA